MKKPAMTEGLREYWKLCMETDKITDNPEAWEKAVLKASNYKKKKLNRFEHLMLWIHHKLLYLRVEYGILFKAKAKWWLTKLGYSVFLGIPFSYWKEKEEGWKKELEREDKRLDKEDSQ